MFDSVSDILTVNEVCSLLKIGKNVCYKLIKEKKLKSVKFCSKYLIPKAYLIDFVSKFEF